MRITADADSPAAILKSSSGISAHTIPGKRSNGREDPYLRSEINFDPCLHLAQSVVDKRVATSTTTQIENVTLSAVWSSVKSNTEVSCGSGMDIERDH